MAYGDPAVRLSLGSGVSPITSSTFTGTRTFNFSGSRSFTFNGTGGFPGGLATGRAGNVAVVSSNEQIETFVGVGLVAVGLLLELFSLFLWQAPVQPPKAATG